MTEKINLTIFTDPMMGLSYESEPIIERFQKEYTGKIQIQYIMSFLVRDVSDFMLPEERNMGPTAGIKKYCQRLAQIYKSEEHIGGLPMNMEGFCLFDVEHRSSKPLNLAYKAAQLADSNKADVFLTALRHANVLDCRPTTHFDEIIAVAREIGIDEAKFIKHYQDGSAEAALEKDLALTRSLNIYSLPAYLLQSEDKAILMQSFDYQDFVVAISKVMQHIDKC